MAEWAYEDKLRAVAMRDAGVHIVLIAERFGRTPRAMKGVLDKIQNEGLKPPPGTTVRRCLGCNEPFASEGKHNRLCRWCNDSANHRYAPIAYAV